MEKLSSKRGAVQSVPSNRPVSSFRSDRPLMAADEKPLSTGKRGCYNYIA